MSRFMRMSGVIIATLVVSVLASAAEDKVEKMTSDQTQATYKRKSMTFIGIAPKEGVPVEEEYLEIISDTLRKKLELPRFDYNNINLSNIFTIDQFVKELREFVKKRSYDRAAAEAEYEARFKSARVYMTDIDRIMSSAYFYTLTVTSFSSVPFTCPVQNQGGTALGAAVMNATMYQCVPGTPGVLTRVDVKATYYRANLLDESKPPYELVKDVSWIPEVRFSPIVPPPPPPPGASPTQREAWDREMSRFNSDLPQKRHAATVEATKSACDTLGDHLAKEMKKVPDFQLLTPVQAALSDGVEFMLGKKEGLALDDTYEVTEFDAAGSKNLIGYVKVRNVSEPKGTGEGTPSYAEKVKEKRDFVGGELLVEHPMIGWSFHFSGAFEVAIKSLSAEGKDQMGFYPGATLSIEKDMANWFGWPEFYLTFPVVDFLYITDTDSDVKYLDHFMVGLMKKWYANSAVFTVGIRGGLSAYWNTGDTGDKAYIGGGGDLVLGFEYYFTPEWSVFLNLSGRFFTNPLPTAGALKNDFEMGGIASLGIVGSI